MPTGKFARYQQTTASHPVLMYDSAKLAQKQMPDLCYGSPNPPSGTVSPNSSRSRVPYSSSRGHLGIQDLHTICSWGKEERSQQHCGTLECMSRNQQKSTQAATCSCRPRTEHGTRERMVCWTKRKQSNHSPAAAARPVSAPTTCARKYSSFDRSSYQSCM